MEGIIMKWFCNSRLYKMSHVGGLILIMLLCSHLNLSFGHPKEVDNHNESSTVSCKLYNGRVELTTLVEDSSSLCDKSPQGTPLSDLCLTFNALNKMICETLPTIPDVNLSNSSVVCEQWPSALSPVKLPTESLALFENITNETFCKSLCANETQPKITSLCLLTKRALDIILKLDEPVNVKLNVSVKPNTTITSTTQTTVVTTSTKAKTSPPLFNIVKYPGDTLEDGIIPQITLSPDDDGDDRDDGDGDDVDMGQLDEPAKTVVDGAKPADETSKTGHPNHEIGTFSIGYDDGNSHFFVYFLTIVVLFILGYVLYHNKKKLIALIVEGRQERKRRPNTNQYRKLDNNLEEVMQTSGNGGEKNGSKRSSVIY